MKRNFSPISLEGTVVGLLFSKTGKEIKEAVNAKVKDLEEEVKDLEESIEDVDEFLEVKEKELTELNKLYEDRQNEKDAQARPFKRQMDEIRKAWVDKEFELNRETEKLVGDKAVSFEEGFDKFNDRFEEIDELADEVEEGNMSYMCSMASNVGVGTSAPSRMMRATGMSLNDSIDDSLPTKQDKALSCINTLRNKVLMYRSKITTIQNRIRYLETEIEELSLIKKHLKDEREYTLDLDRLSSLGFEA